MSSQERKNCNQCQYYQVHITDRDEYPPCVAIAYCKKLHWGNGDPDDNIQFDCNDFEQLKLTNNEH